MNSIEEAENFKVKPFLRWAGGKSWMVEYVKSLLVKNSFKCYHEPFLGGASMFLSINPNRSYLSDINKELIITYKTIKSDYKGVLKELKKFKNSEQSYYMIRGCVFDSDIKRAAQFIYLNKTSFNGIYRVNLNGEYNVPYGFRDNKIFDEVNFEEIQKRLLKATIINCDFESIEENIKVKDLIFLDPPYTVSHNLNGFLKYNQKIFSINDQYRLSILVDKIKSKGAFYILTNAAHEAVIEIFDKNDNIFKLSRGNLVGGLKAKRGSTEECLFTNLKI